jgi:5-methylcytosine-specific restriction endonuclease McrA
MPEAIRQQVLARDNYHCVLPPPHEGRLEVDHIIPVSRGGPHTLANGRTLCLLHHRQVTGRDFGFKSR